MTGKYDFIILGASGFTGQFVLEEVAAVCSKGNKLKYAIAGRNKCKLENSLENAKKNRPEGIFDNVEIILVDVDDHVSLVDMAKKGKVIINCVGPYRFYGMKIVTACIEGGADHVDISGEPQYLEEVQLNCHANAQENGVHIVGSCGFDSVPADMGTIFMQGNFPGDVNSIEMIVGNDDSSKGSAAINVTTLECALHGYNNRRQLGKIRREIFKERTPKPNHKADSRGTIWWSDEAQRWCVPNMASDRSVVLRTQNLNYKLINRRPVQFNAFFGMKSICTSIASMIFGFIFAAMAPFKFTRDLFLKYPSFFSFGAFSKEGANREDLKDMKFRLTFVARGWDTKLNAPEEQHQDPPSVTKVAHVIGPDPGYFGTAIIIVQSALTILQEKNNLPKGGGVYTPGSAFINTSLIQRLEEKGIQFVMASKNEN